MLRGGPFHLADLYFETPQMRLLSMRSASRRTGFLSMRSVGRFYSPLVVGQGNRLFAGPQGREYVHSGNIIFLTD